MGKLKLQMHMTVDGMVSGAVGQVPFNWNEELMRYSVENAANTATILIGRRIAADFIRHWKTVADDSNNSDHELGKRITDLPKVIFSKTQHQSPWSNTTLAHGDLTSEVNRLKRRTNGELLVYGGRGFVASLVEHNLIDEYHLLLNPIAIGSGMTIFSGLTKTLHLKLSASKAFSSGTVLLRYEVSCDDSVTWGMIGGAL